MSSSRTLNNKTFFNGKPSNGGYNKELSSNLYASGAMQQQVLQHNFQTSQQQHQLRHNIIQNANTGYGNNYGNPGCIAREGYYYNNQNYLSNVYPITSTNSNQTMNNMRNDNKQKRGIKSIINNRTLPIKNNLNNKNSKSAKSINSTSNYNKYTKNIRYNEVYDETDIIRNDTENMQNLLNKYFSEPIDLNKYRDNDGKIKPVIKSISKQEQQANKKFYKLTVPINLKKDTYTSVNNLIEDTYRSIYYSIQPFKVYGENQVHLFRTLDEIVEKLKKLNNKDMEEIESFNSYAAAKPNKPTRVLKSSNDRSLIGNASMKLASNNDSFELSFDGKALDRSDILRMVDSFSIAFSDDDDYEGQAESTFDDEFNTKSGKYEATLSNKILPAEITGGGF